MTTHGRPKSLIPKSVKFPAELYHAIALQCARHPHGQSFSDWVKHACEFRLAVLLGNELGYYALYELLRARSSENWSDAVLPRQTTS